MAARGASLEEIRRRGRWLALSSVQRYTKTFVLTKSRASMTKEQLDMGYEFWQAPYEYIYDAALRDFGTCKFAGLWKDAIDSYAHGDSVGRKLMGHVSVDTPVGDSAEDHDFSAGARKSGLF